MTCPYTYADPVDDRASFFARRSEIMRISSRIGAERPQSVSVVGEPKSGKTSLLKWLMHPESQAGYLDEPALYVYLFLRLKDAMPETPEGFFQLVDARFQQVGLTPMTPTYDGFGRRVSELGDMGKRLVLFCDDFEVLTQNDRVPLEFYSFLRSQANNHDVGYVMTSSAPLHKLCASQDLEESPFFNIFTPVKLKPFGDAEARALVQEPAERAGTPFGEEIEWILELGGSQPYLLQLTAALAFEMRSEAGFDRDALSQKAAAEAEGYFRQLADGFFSEAHCEVVKLVCAGQPVENQLQYAADDLVNRGYLRKADGQLVLGSQLLREFIARSRKKTLWERLFGR